MNNKYVVAIGAANVDIGGKPFNHLNPRDSNPGIISITYGGVARNIAHNLALLGVNVKLVSAIGDDNPGNNMRSYCNNAGIDTSLMLTIPGERSSMYLYINDTSGDMAVAVNQTTICSHITPEYIDSIADEIRGASAVVIDTNISKETINHVKEISRAPVYIDPVSTEKSDIIVNDLEGIECIKPNRIEAEYMTGMTIKTEADYRAAAKALLEMGVKRIFISMGSIGMLAADMDHIYIIGKYPADLVDTAGAGDSATATIVWADMMLRSKEAGEKEEYDPLITVAKAANAVASITIESEHVNSPALSEKSALERIASYEPEVIDLKMKGNRNE